MFHSHGNNNLKRLIYPLFFSVSHSNTHDLPHFSLNLKSKETLAELQFITGTDTGTDTDTGATTVITTSRSRFMRLRISF
ncbi:hypothetical protein PIB30_044226 [Stylosanthes scabra]|uniref:Uncharacterized protein n=1 Tax=Stylosanthes scabra TaxID=79078 RepID=A0ABU6VGT5_9FABA|nr:hypothetical protein [Stylosanthes scabra]